MKLAVLLGIFVVACMAQGHPIGCEDEPEIQPKQVEEYSEPKVVDIVPEVFEEDLTDFIDGVQKSNVIDGPKVCPEGQILDHQGKCRPVMG